MHDISATGLTLTLVASKTFPTGITLTAFADDADPFDIPAVTIAESAMGINGDLVTWSKASPIAITVNLVPGSDDAENLTILGNLNRPEKGRRVAGDVITLTGVYPNGKTRTFGGGRLTSYIPGDAAASAGRLKTKPFVFTFESISGTKG